MFKVECLRGYMRFFVFLMAASIYGANLSFDSPIRMTLVDDDCVDFRAYRCKNEEGEENLITVSYFWEHKKPDPNVGVLEIKNVQTGCGLTISMEYGENPQELLQTEICFKDDHDRVAVRKKDEEPQELLQTEICFRDDHDRAAVRQKAVVTSIANPIENPIATGPKVFEQNEGCVTVMAPFSAPTTWTVSKLPNRSRNIQATVSSDENGITITRYLFCTGHDEHGVFVRMRVQDLSLDGLVLSFGVGAYGASFYPGSTYGAREDIWDKKLLGFSRSFLQRNAPKQ